MSAERYGSDITMDSHLRTDRRRPGPRMRVNAALIPLLRGQNTWDQSIWEQSRDRLTPRRPQLDADRDPLSAARGIALAIAVCGVFWVGVASLFW